MTAMLRAKFGLNDVLGLNGEKNRNDHRHHAVDACVIGVTDQGMLQRFAKASSSARERQLDRLVENMPLPWGSYRAHVQRAIEAISDPASPWLCIEHRNGPGPVTAAYQKLLTGGADPRLGYILSLSPATAA